MTAIDYLLRISKACGGFFSIEKSCAKATNSEIRRWFKNKAVIISGRTPSWDEEVIFPVGELILFPQSKTRRTSIVGDSWFFERWRQRL
jgi:hypothetical protein